MSKTTLYKQFIYCEQRHIARVRLKYQTFE